MEDNRRVNSFDDPFLERMFEKLPVEKTSSDFSMLVMSQIYASVEPEIEPSKYRNQMLWGYGLIGAGIVIITLILFAIWPFFEINLTLNPKRIINLLTTSLNIFDRISQFGEWFKASSIQLSIFFSVFVLFLIERLFRKGVSSTNTYIL